MAKSFASPTFSSTTTVAPSAPRPTILVEHGSVELPTVLQHTDLDQGIEVCRQHSSAKRIRVGCQQTSEVIHSTWQDPSTNFTLECLADGRIRPIWKRLGKAGRPIIGIQGLPHSSSDNSIRDILPSSSVQELEGFLIPIRGLSLEILIKFSFSVTTLELTTDELDHIGDSRHAVSSHMIWKR